MEEIGRNSGTSFIMISLYVAYVQDFGTTLHCNVLISFQVNQYN